MIEIVVITGHLETGKTDLAERLSSEHGFTIVRTSKLVKEISSISPMSTVERTQLQKLGEDLDAKSASKWVFDEVKRLVSSGNKKIVIDHIRNRAQLSHFRMNPKWKTTHVHLYAPESDLIQQFEEKARNEQLDYTTADPIESEEDIKFFKGDADIRINTKRTDKIDTYIRVVSRLRLFSNTSAQCVDVLVGGQFGSEGKGHIAASIAKSYSLLVRVGGPNAGHTVSSDSGVYTYHQLPSGSKDSKAKLLLGPGMTINKKKLLEEISDCEIDESRLCIDPQAILITEEDIENEEIMRKQIASTASGSGAASARRILSRTANPPKLAGGDIDLKKYTEKRDEFAGDAVSELEKYYKEKKLILLEGTQGSGLSIFNGQYPHVTSRDTNVAGCLAEVGISPKRVRRIIMVVRTTPIRVGNPEKGDFTSGNLKNPTTFEIIADQSGLNSDKVVAAEKTSTTKRNRKVGWFDWELFRRSCMINTPTDIALTFVDYLDSKNQDARRFEQLTDNTIKFIEEIEHVAQAPVSIINTRFRAVTENPDLRTMIDRRDWR